MAQLSTYKLEGQETLPFKNSKNVLLEAVFSTENTADISLTEVVFSNNNESNDSDRLRDLWQSKPYEGAKVDITIQDIIDGTLFDFGFDFYCDWNEIQFPADNETQVKLLKRSSVSSFDLRAKSVTFALLEDKNFLTLSDYQNIPYIIENRKTLLEKIQLLAQLFQAIKIAADETHKILNIASDITTLGAVQAGINLTFTLLNLVLMINQFKQLFIDIQEAFFPPILYHSGIKPKVFMQKAIEYLQYDAIEFGSHVPQGATKSFGEIMDKITWCPSKNDEIGIPANVLNPISGAMHTSDFGSNLFEAMEYFVEYYNCKKAVIDNVVHLRPKSDPFWLQSAGAPEPDVLVESSEFVSNGITRPNYEDAFSSTVLQYATDDSDLHTLRDLADENDPNSSQKIISGVIVEPDAIDDPKCVIAQQGKFIDIPHALCVRKDVIDDLLDTFINFGEISNQIKDKIKEYFDQVTDVISDTFPALEPFIESVGGRSGCMTIENHFFSTAKTVYLEDIDTGFEIAPRIPSDFADHIGAQSLIEDYQNYDSLVPGVRNPSNPNDTNAKYIFEDVKIQMNIEKFTQILNNPYFNVAQANEGKYHAVKWNVEEDFATVTYWKQIPWLQNVTQSTIITP